MIITKEQRKTIESLIPEYEEALVAYGGDMYCQGLICGAISVAIGMVLDRMIDGLMKNKD